MTTAPVIWTMCAGLCLGGLAACVGAPEGEDMLDDGDDHDDRTVARDAWVDAPAGCEDTDARDLELVGCQGEPLLGALVDAEGRVRCVDAWSLLARETRFAPDVALRPSDPSPQPSHPGLGGARTEAALSVAPRAP